MVETNLFRKNKINLEDYDYQKDIKNRVLMSYFSSEDLEVLEEIIYSCPTLSVDALAKQLKKDVSQLSIILEKLALTELFKIEHNILIVDKEMRKYFEVQIQKFEEGFSPGIEFLQSLLKKVPIHVLPNWYPIPRASNNIFDSLIEKYLKTPQTFQRYLSELNLGDPVLNDIVKEIFVSPEYKVYSTDIRKKYHLSKEDFEKQVLYLEFNLICCLVYEKQEDQWVEVLTLFREWKEYLHFVKASQPEQISNKKKIHRTRPHDFSFVEDLSHILILGMKKPIYVKLNREEEWVFDKTSALTIAKQCKGFDLSSEEGLFHFESYMSKVIHKLLFLKLAFIEENQLIPFQEVEDWLTLPVEKRALNSYKATLTTYPFSKFSKEVYSDRNIHEIEKSVTRIIDSGWVLFEDFLNSIVANISDKSKMSLKKLGKHWKYSRPDYSKEEIDLIHLIIYEWLFEGGMIATGTFEGKECLRITSFGHSIFG